MNPSGMKVIARKGDVIGAQVVGFTASGVLLELDSCQQTHLSTSRLAGKDMNAKLDRLSRLTLNAAITVRVLNVFQGRDFQDKLEVCEFSSTPESKRRPKHHRNGRRRH